MLAPKVRMLFGFSTVIVADPTAKVTTPLSVRLLGELPMISWVLAVIGLSTVRVLLTARSLVPSVMTSVPSPSGPAVIVPPTALGVLSKPTLMEPAVRLMPVEPMIPKVLLPASWRLPAPALVMTFVAPAPVMGV